MRKILLGIFIIGFITGCGADPQPRVIIKKVFVKQKCPKLQTVEFNDTDTDSLKINVKRMQK